MKKLFFTILIILGISANNLFAFTLFEDSFDFQLDSSVWWTEIVDGKQWYHTSDYGGSAVSPPHYGSIDRMLDVMTYRTDFDDFVLSWDMLYVNQGSGQDRRSIHFRSTVEERPEGYEVYITTKLPPNYPYPDNIFIDQVNADGSRERLASYQKPTPWILGLWYHFELSVYENEFKLKVWEDGETKPTDWTLSAIDSDSSYTQGAIGIGDYWDAVTYVDNVTVTVSAAVHIEMIGNLVSEVISLNLKQGIENSLDAKLSCTLEALDDLNENNDVAAINSLWAFINAVEAQCGKHITEADADRLITAAMEIIELLENPGF